MTIISKEQRDYIVNIRKARVKLQYSQEYMAAKLAISQNAYSKLELGYSNLTVERLLSICRLLAIDPVDVFAGIEPNEQAA
jgi:transcriptional regulator with XRE-family HTH domain